MYDLNSPIANFATFLKNYTPNTIYGVTCNGKFFTLSPESSISFPMNSQSSNIINDLDANPNTLYSGIFVLVYGNQTSNQPNMIIPSAIDGKWYKTPTPNEAVYIDDLNCILFASDKERYDEMEKYGDISKLVKAYAANSIPLINSSYVAITCLNKDKQFYLVHDRTADPLPIETSLTANDYEKKYGITKEMLEVNYVFIVNTIIRSSGKSRQVKDTSLYTEIKKVAKNSLNKNEPIIFSNIGLVLFEDRNQANNFLDKYGVLTNYLIAVALNTTHSIHDAEIEDLNKRATKDKKGIVETFGIMGGTSAVSILTENLIKCSTEDDNKESMKKAGKAFVIGVGALASVVGLYKLYRWWEKKKEEKKNK